MEKVLSDSDLNLVIMTDAELHAAAEADALAEIRPINREIATITPRERALSLAEKIAELSWESEGVALCMEAM